MTKRRSSAAGVAQQPEQTTLEHRLSEAFDELWSDFVDPREAVCDADGAPWLRLGNEFAAGGAGSVGCTNELQLAQIRMQCRALAESNEFAINGHENRISFVVGAGHTYRAALKAGAAAPPQVVQDVQAVLDQFLRDNQWHARQQEVVRRRDRDGEAFLRMFVAADGAVRVRFVEPGQVSTPPERAADPAASFGVETDPRDVETVLAYYVDGRPVAADEIQHRKANVDANVKRGLPLFFPVIKNLRRAEKLLRNMSVVSEIQSAIALIRKHRGGVKTAVQQFAADQADLSRVNPSSGGTSHFKRYAPGTILDAPGSVDYDFPAAGIDAGNFVTVLQAELRAVASRLVMPEFMLTSDASNANYASTMVAEGPAVRMFGRLQAEQIAADRQVMDRVVEAAVAAGRLPRDVLDAVLVHIEPPSLAVRDQLDEARAHRIEMQSGVLSPQTWSQRRGLNYEQEQENIRSHTERIQ